MQHDIEKVAIPAHEAASTDLRSIDTTSLHKLGLSETDIKEIEKVAQTIKADDPESVSTFGRDVAQATSKYADGLLSQIHNRDLDEAGTKLNKVVTIARNVHTRGMTGKPRRFPILSRVVDRIRVRGKAVMGNFEATKTQIDTLIEEVNGVQSNIAERNLSLDAMYASVQDEYHLLGVHIAAGRSQVLTFREKAEALHQSGDTSPMMRQRLSDLEALTNSLDKRVGDLMALQQSALQSLPTIRLIQANNQMLVDKFHTIREVTVPSWKRQFMLAISLNEQRNAVTLANAIDDTTNDLLKRNAKLLYNNAVETAKANQRLVIDVDTLKQVQDTLVKSVQDVVKIHTEGKHQREKALHQIENMRDTFQQRLLEQQPAATSHEKTAVDDL